MTDRSTQGELEEYIAQLGGELWREIQAAGSPGLFDSGYWQGRMLDWAMRDPAFKLDMFRFVDVLPSLRSSEDVSRHIREYLLHDGHNRPAMIGAALKLAAGHGLTGAMGAGLAARAIRANVTSLAQRFIIGRDAADALPKLRRLWAKEGLASTVDLLGEATVSDAEAKVYQQRYLELINQLAKAVGDWPDDAVLERNHLGPIPRANVSVKVSALAPHLDPVDPRGAVQRLLPPVKAIVAHARRRGVFVHFDLEQWTLHGITYDLFEALLEDDELRAYPHLGIVVQAYLCDAADDVQRLAALAQRRGAPITVRLVKGAYWENEIVRHAQTGQPLRVFTDKAATDANFERLSTLLLENVEHLLPAFGSHNLRSLAHALAQAEALGVPRGAYEIQMLYGMAEPERAALRQRGYRVRLYCPIGELLPGVAYLVRRLLENTSNSGFLRLSHREGVEIGKLLAAPVSPSTNGAGEGPVIVPAPQATPEYPHPSPLPQKGEGAGAPQSGAFSNCPHSDFTDPAVRDAFATALTNVREGLPVAVPRVIGGVRRQVAPILTQHCPSRTEVRASVVTCTSVVDVDEAVRRSFGAWPAWRDHPLAGRAVMLDRLADLLERDRLELAALQVWEVGKPCADADADVAEAIDFCRYYARQAMTELAPRPTRDVAGERNVMWYEGRGPAAIIAPWNFPLAILTGITAAALVAGNTVLIKPAEQSSGVAYRLHERLAEAGFGADVVQFLPGRGEEVGARLVSHPEVALIAFTGSKAVGLGIIAAAGLATGTQAEATGRQVKRVVCEMGGKNAIIVDDDADLDEAVTGVLHSALGYAGQKCSACSRVLVVAAAYEAFVKRLVEACRSVVIAPADEASCQLGPVVEEAAYRRLMQVINSPGDGAELLFRGALPVGLPQGWYVPPVLLAVHDAGHRLMQEEFFGPVVAVMKCADFAQAIEVANSTAFALTGGVYSRTPSHLDLARRAFRVGNLYLNRGCTGALVGRQPFGGFARSGLGTKAGGPDYLIHFADPRVVTENTMRHGLTPELDT